MNQDAVLALSIAPAAQPGFPAQASHQEFGAASNLQAVHKANSWQAAQGLQL